MRWTEQQRVELKARWASGERPVHIRRAMGLTNGQLAGFRTRHTLHTPVRRRSFANPDAISVVTGTTRFPSTVTDRGAALKPGQYQSKLGKRVEKGRWRGMPIYALTLEERATCPKDCKLWVACFGNHMHLARRMRHGPALERKLWVEMGALQTRHPAGFVLRIHLLGDFYSVGYVEMWREALSAFPALHVFGYTARQDRIGRSVAALRGEMWDRFAVRTSGALAGPRTLVIENEGDAPAGAIVCPAQTNKTRSCGTCGLCWQTQKPIAFIRH